MLNRIFAILALAVVFNPVQAKGLDLRLSDKTAEFIYLTESSTFGYGGADVGLGFFYNDADDFMFSAAAMVSGHGSGNNRPLQFGVGVKVAFATLDLPDMTAGALAVGGQIRYVFPSTTPFALLAEGFISPDITTFGDAEQMLEYRFALELEVTPSARAYVGYRKIEFDLDGINDYEVDDEVHLGVRLAF
ncbi:MAG: YfaZ family protein [Gammaproteobacteria bacterium]|nr:YfaZ family protein [Gammaproteobacteria bacterium]